MRGEALKPRVLFSDAWRLRLDGSVGSDLLAAFDGRDKLIIDRKANVMRLVDQNDPEERPIVGSFRTSEKALVDQAQRYLEYSGGSIMFDQQ
jgi:hypothetical protein